MASFEKYPMLAEGYEKLTTDLKRLRDERPLIVEAIEDIKRRMNQFVEYDKDYEFGTYTTPDR
jgi:transcription elongation GreA/GreB family factor